MIDFSLDNFLKKLSPIKLFLIGILTNGIFWYFSIFLFAEHLILKKQFQIPIIISLCFSFLWFCLTVWYFALKRDNSEPYLAKNVKIRKSSIRDNVVFSTIILGFIIGFTKIFNVFVVPLNSKFRHFSFTGFILITFFIIVLMLTKQISKAIKRQKEHEKKTQDYFEKNIKKQNG